MERIPRPGEFYRHFKNKLYQIITIARHSESGEKMVVYQAMYGDYGMYVRPLAMFVSEVDRRKYPDVVQKYRFEQVLPGKDAAETFIEEEGTPRCLWLTEEEEKPNPWFLRFLDANTYESRLDLLEHIDDEITQEMLEGIYEILDMPAGTGSIEEQIFSVRRYLETQKKYDGTRLR